jgi:5-methylcytosine-specific restriction protein A
MARSTDEWIGKTDDSKPPTRVCQRVFDRANGICHFCGQPIQKPHQKHETDHKKALINGGENRESNLAPIHKDPCHKVKTAADINTKKKVAKVRQKHLGIKKVKAKIASRPSPPKPAGKHSLPPRIIYR